MKENRKHRPKVAILVETSRGYSRDILRGILQFEMRHGPWDIYAVPAGREEQKLPDMSHAGKKGVIAHIATLSLAEDVAAAKLPTVSVFPTDDIPNFGKQLRHYGEVRFDSPAVGLMGAEYFLERHLPHFGFVGEIYDADWSVLRRDAFSQKIAQSGFETFLYPTPAPEKQNWNIEQKILSQWLRRLPKPIGILSASDIRGRNVIDACYLAKIVVPDEVSVIGVDNDELFCETTRPKLSSIAIDAERAGFTAALILDRLMNGEKKKQTALFGPLHVISRHSSEVLLVEDKLVHKAMLYIRDFYTKPIGVPDVVTALDISRRQLEIRFKREIGHSISEEIKKCRIERVKRLLLESDLTLDKIAPICGFQSKYYLVNLFRKETGMTTGMFRTRYRQ
jgi:LacI family transcriptional regulator